MYFQPGKIWELEHGGYIVKVFPCPIVFKIVERLPDNKFKNRRTTGCNQYTGKRDHYGQKLYTPFESQQQALDRAKNYIDHHIIPWAQSPNNRQSVNYKP